MFQWTEARVAAVINSRSSEGQSLEFKSQLPLSNDKGRAEFLKDVSALANSSGGAILFGVREEAGAAESLSGLQLSDADAEIRRLAQILESGIEPRLSGVRILPLSLGESDVLIVEVPQSFDAPHRYHFNGHSKFVQRNATHVAELSYDQLRSAFNRSAERLERLRADWDKDLALGAVWRPLENGPVAVLRVSSLVAAERKQIIEPRAAHEKWSELILSDWGGGSPFYNYDGFAVAPSRAEATAAYTQVHRTGAISSFRTVGTEYRGENLFIPGRAEKFFVEASEVALAFLQAMGVAGSAILYAGVSRLTGWSLATSGRYGVEERVLSVLERIQLPEAFVEDISAAAPTSTLFRPAFDVLWQAFGKSGCPHFSPEGDWSLS